MRQYYGHAVNVYEALPGGHRLAQPTDLAPDARCRLGWFDYYSCNNTITTEMR